MKKLIFLFALAGCVSKQEIEANLYQIDRIPAELCTTEIQKYGIFRVVDCTPQSEVPECKNGAKNYQEYIPFCSERMNEFLAADKIKVAEWLRQITRPRP